MIFRDVPLTEVDFEDETLRISEDLDLPEMQASLRAVGLIHPVMLCEGSAASRYIIICGFRRLHGMRGLGAATIAARIQPSSSAGILGLFLMAIWDNLSHRRLGPLETSRTLITLKQACGVDNRTLVERYLPLFGLSPHENVLRSYLNLQQLQSELRRMLQAGHLTLASAERLAQETAAAQAGLAHLFGGIRLSASLQREVLELAQDLAAITRTTLAEVLCGKEISAIAEDPTLSAFQKGEQIHAFLCRRRNPRISRARDKFHADKAAMDLPGTVRLSADPFFERPRLRVEFDVTSARDFRATVAALERSAGKAALDRLFEVT